MSRSDEQWHDAQRAAIRIRSRLYDILDELSEWDIAFDDCADTEREALATLCAEAVWLSNSIIGSTIREWDIPGVEK